MGTTRLPPSTGAICPTARYSWAPIPTIPPDCMLPPQYRLDVSTATDEQIVDDISQMIAQYMYGPAFQARRRRELLRIALRRLPANQSLANAAARGRDRQQYAAPCFRQVVSLSNPIYRRRHYGNFQYHAQPFVFGATELAGLKIFLTAARRDQTVRSMREIVRPAIWLPNFTDFQFHNTGVAGRI